MEEVIKNICLPDDNLKAKIEETIKKLGGISAFIKSGERVLIKPNFNTADPFPASTDPKFLQAVVELVLETGVSEIIIGESSTFYQNTRKNLDKLGIFGLEKMDPRVKVVSFDDGPWIKKEVKSGKYLKQFSVPDILDKVDRIIFLPCVKTHFIAKYTGALKLGVGLMKPKERLLLHAKNPEEKIAEMNLIFRPDLIIMDGRKCFITQGPTKGEIREPSYILASTSRINIDVEEIKIIKSFVGNSLENTSIEDLKQIKVARQINIR